MATRRTTGNQSLSVTRIVARIRHLHATGQPLNISAVRRSYPDLLEGTFAQRPFLGWRGALRAAGIDYANIKVELEDFVTCQICGKRLRSVATHARVLHGYDHADYRREFPDAEMLSDTARAKANQFARQQILPHWEPFWTWEYILDRIHALHAEVGYPLSYSAMTTADMGLSNAVTKAKFILGGWNEIVTERLGLEPADARLKGKFQKLPAQRGVKTASRYPDETAVIAGIQNRQRHGRDLSHTAVWKGTHPDRSLVRGGERHFGAWPAALQASGIDPASVNLPRAKFYPDRFSVRQAIQYRVTMKWPINQGALFRGEFQDERLCIAARELYGSWDAALLDAGLDALQVRKRKSYKTPEQVIDAIKERYQEGLPMNPTRVISGTPSQRKLFWAARHHFGDWQQALAAAGLPPCQGQPGRPRAEK